MTGGGWVHPASQSPGHASGRGTYADIAHLLCDLDLHVAAVPLLPSPLAVLGASAIVTQGL